MIIRMKKGSNHQEMRRSRWGVLCGKVEYTEGVEGAHNEKECQIEAVEHR